MKTERFFGKDAAGVHHTFYGSRKEFDHWLKEPGRIKAKTPPPDDDPAAGAMADTAQRERLAAAGNAATVIEAMQNQIDALTAIVLGKDAPADRALLENVSVARTAGKGPSGKK